MGVFLFPAISRGAETRLKPSSPPFPSKGHAKVRALDKRSVKKAVVAFLLLAHTWPIGHLAAEEIVVFGNDSKPPKIWKDGDVPKGILVDILKALEGDLGVSFHIVTYPWKRAYTSAVRGRGAIVGLSKTEERLTAFDYSDPLYIDEAILVVKSGAEFPFNTFVDLHGKVIGTYSGSSFGLAYEEAKAHFKVVEDYSSAVRLKKVLAGRIDAAAISPGRAALENICASDPGLNMNAFGVLPKPLTHDPNHLAFVKTMHREDFLTQFNRVLHEKIQSGAVQAIIKRY